jgi:hypothetical protein
MNSLGGEEALISLCGSLIVLNREYVLSAADDPESSNTQRLADAVEVMATTVAGQPALTLRGVLAKARVAYALAPSVQPGGLENIVAFSLIQDLGRPGPDLTISIGTAVAASFSFDTNDAATPPITPR